MVSIAPESQLETYTHFFCFCSVFFRIGEFLRGNRSLSGYVSIRVGKPEETPCLHQIAVAVCRIHNVESSRRSHPIETMASPTKFVDA